jgi:hypothetical protein
VIPSKPSWRWLDSLNISRTDVLVRRDGWREALPNPLALATRLSSEPFCSRHLPVPFGRAHGDLNLGNVLMPVDPPRPREYKLIDLGGFSPKAPLARDPMHLLLSIAVEWLKGGITPGTPLSRTLIKVIVSPRAQTTEKECQKVSRAIHETGRSWAAKTRSLGDDWTRQSLLSLVGCGMLYAGRQIPGLPDTPATPGWFFDLAAVAARAYLMHARLWDRYTEGLSSPPQRSGFANTSTDPPAPQDSRPGAQAPSPAPQSSGPEPEESPEPETEESPGAQILQFRRSATRNDHGTVDSAEPQQAGEQDQWEDVTDALRRAVFDPSGWLSLTAGTDALLRQLQETREMGLPPDDDIGRNLWLLDRILTDVLRPSVSSADLHSACTRAEIIRGRLLQLFAGPGK